MHNSEPENHFYHFYLWTSSLFLFYSIHLLYAWLSCCVGRVYYVEITMWILFYDGFKA